MRKLDNERHIIDALNNDETFLAHKLILIGLGKCDAKLAEHRAWSEGPDKAFQRIEKFKEGIEQ